MELHIDELFFQFHAVHLIAATAKMIEYIVMSPNASCWQMAQTKVKCLYNNNNQTFLFQFDWDLESCFKDNCVICTGIQTGVLQGKEKGKNN